MSVLSLVWGTNELELGYHDNLEGIFVNISPEWDC